MTQERAEVVAWRWRKPVVNGQGETIGETAWELSDAPGFLPWWTNEPLIRLSDYQRLQADHERLQAECEKLRKQAEDGWIQDGFLLYRLTDEPRPRNRDEINVTMANSSRTKEARTRRASELLDAIRAAAPQAVQARKEKRN